jgi:prepilin-type N-terminal cleavage/methylation domain-containing protein
VAGIHPNRRPTTLRGGFSLIELMIVVVIVGVLVGVAIPNVGRSINTDRANRSAAVVMGMLDEAGQLAARRRAPVTVTLLNGSVIIRDRATSAVLKQRSFGAENDLRATLTFTPNTGITIFPNGRATSNLRVNITGGNATAGVTRTAAGILRRD